MLLLLGNCFWTVVGWKEERENKAFPYFLWTLGSSFPIPWVRTRVLILELHWLLLVFRYIEFWLGDTRKKGVDLLPGFMVLQILFFLSVCPAIYFFRVLVVVVCLLSIDCVTCSHWVREVWVLFYLKSDSLMKFYWDWAKPSSLVYKLSNFGMNEWICDVAIVTKTFYDWTINTQMHW